MNSFNGILIAEFSKVDIFLSFILFLNKILYSDENNDSYPPNLNLLKTPITIKHKFSQFEVCSELTFIL